MNINQNITKTIGHTPLVRINRLCPDSANDKCAEILAKVEFFNPGASVKDRIALNIVTSAETAGALKPGGTIVEATSGNTGVGLAMVGAALGYKVVIAMPESMSKERRALMRSYGAELVLTPPSLGMKGAVAAAEKIVTEREGAVLARQFANPANPAAHYANTAEEIWADTDGNIDVFVAGIGTGGTVSGIGKRLKELNPELRVYGIEPAESSLILTGEAGPHGIQGLGANFVPDTLDMSVVDEFITITTPLALETSRRAARKEGLLVGISSGAALAGALQLASRPENWGKRIVTLLPDTGERYLSTPLYSSYMD